MLDGKVKNSKYPLLYHITPEKGLLNDPNGVIKFQGVYHVFYQWNPYGTIHKNKCWGHVFSTDMVHWQRAPIALTPSADYDKDGIYSGSAIEKDGLLYVFYTGTVAVSHTEKKSYQCAAVSVDGFHFKKLGPLFEHPKGYTRHVRDPKVWFNEEKENYCMILGAQTDDLSGDILLYQSKDLLDWNFKGSLMNKRPTLGYMWECPDLLFFEQTILLFSPQGLKAEDQRFDNIHQTGYLKGKLDQSDKFLWNGEEFIELDRGFEFYAPQTFQDNERVILYGWMGIMPEEYEQSMPTVTEGWAHTLSIPREVTFSKGKIYQYPVSELKSLRDNSRKRELKIGSKQTVKLGQPYHEINLFFNQPSTDFTLTISETFTVQYTRANSELSISRYNWFTGKVETRVGLLNDELSEMILYLDGSTIEIFVNKGDLVFSSRYFNPDSERELVFNGSDLNLTGVMYPLVQ